MRKVRLQQPTNSVLQIPSPVVSKDLTTALTKDADDREAGTFSQHVHSYVDSRPSMTFVPMLDTRLATFNRISGGAAFNLEMTFDDTQKAACTS